MPSPASSRSAHSLGLASLLCCRSTSPSAATSSGCVSGWSRAGHPADDLAASEAILDRAEAELEELMPAQRPVPATEARPPTPATPVPGRDPGHAASARRWSGSRWSAPRSQPHPRWRRFVGRVTQPRLLVAIGRRRAAARRRAAIFVSEELSSKRRARAAGRSAGAVVTLEVTVAVLNGTSVNGLAGKVATTSRRAATELGAVTEHRRRASTRPWSCTPGPEAGGAEGRPRPRGERPVEPIDRETQRLAGDADVVVIAGEDRASLSGARLARRGALLRPRRRVAGHRGARRPRADPGPGARGASSRRRSRAVFGAGAGNGARVDDRRSSSASPTRTPWSDRRRHEDLVRTLDPRRRPRARRAGHLHAGTAAPTPARPLRRAATGCGWSCRAQDREMVFPRRFTVGAREARTERLGARGRRHPGGLRGCGRRAAARRSARARLRSRSLSPWSSRRSSCSARLGRAARRRLPRTARRRSARGAARQRRRIAALVDRLSSLARSCSRSPPSRSCRCGCRSRSAARPRTCCPALPGDRRRSAHPGHSPSAERRAPSARDPPAPWLRRLLAATAGPLRAPGDLLRGRLQRDREHRLLPRPVRGPVRAPARGRWTRRAARRVLIAVAAVAVGCALIAIYQYFARDLFLNPELFDANQLHVYFRVNSIFFDPNILAPLSGAGDHRARRLHRLGRVRGVTSPLAARRLRARARRARVQLLDHQLRRAARRARHRRGPALALARCGSRSALSASPASRRWRSPAARRPATSRTTAASTAATPT